MPTPSAVPDVLAPGLDVVFCGINPGRVSAEAAAHFANPRNDFWRLLHEAGLTPRLYDPAEQFALLELGIGLTNAAYRTTRGSGDLRAGDFGESAARLEESNILVNYQAAPDEEGFTAAGSLRLGVAEMTRFGMREEDFRGLAGLMHEVLVKGRDVRDEVRSLRERFLDLGFCFTGREFDEAMQRLHRLL